MPPNDSNPRMLSPCPSWNSSFEDPVGRADRQQVQHDRLQRDDDRAEGDQQEQERQAEHEGEHDRQVGRHRVVEVLRAGGHAGHVGLDASDLADRRGYDVVAERRQRGVGGVVGAVAVHRDGHDLDGLVRARAGGDGLGHLAAGECSLAHGVDAGLDLGLGHVVGLDRDERRDRPAGNAAWMRS